MEDQKPVSRMNHEELVKEASRIGVKGSPGFTARNQAQLSDWDDKDLREFVQKNRDR